MSIPSQEGDKKDGTSARNEITRRHFLSTFSISGLSLLAAIAAFIGGGFLYPIERRKPSALFICLESEVPRDRPMEIRDLKGRKVLLMRKADDSILALGTICTHLGCAVHYRPKSRILECPCHQGVFDAEGNPVSGPPQRPLDKHEVIIRDGKVFVQFQ